VCGAQEDSRRHVERARYDRERDNADVRLALFETLNRAEVDVSKLRERRLRQPLSLAASANVRRDAAEDLGSASFAHRNEAAVKRSQLKRRICRIPLTLFMRSLPWSDGSRWRGAFVRVEEMMMQRPRLDLLTGVLSLFLLSNVACAPTVREPREKWYERGEALARERDARAADEQKRDAENAAREKAAADQKVTDAKRAHEDMCTRTRPDRLAELKKAIIAYETQVQKVMPHEAWLQKHHCGYHDTRGILVSRERTAGGVIIRTKHVGDEAELKCDAPLPKGLSLDMVEWYVDFDDKAPIYGSDAKDGVEAKYGRTNGGCEDADRPFGIDFSIRPSDPDVVEKANAILKRAAP
jgi:hypothetical protein